jgi:hypothetical protein
MRFARRGDTIETVRRFSEIPGQRLKMRLNDKDHAVWYANQLIAAGDWRVSRCGQCDKPVGKCQCKFEDGE